ALALRGRWVIGARRGGAQVAQRVGVGPGGSWRPGVRVIAKEFGVDPGTVQRISRPFAATLSGNLSFPDVSAHTQRIQDRGSASTTVGLASNSPPACGPVGYLNGMRPGSELGRQVAVDFESETRAPRIAIVGGGVGGLAAALALERHGAEIVVCEQSPALNEIGAGLNLSPNALMALRVLGVEDAVIALGCESDFLIIRSWKSGRIISHMRRGAFRQQFGAPNLTVHCADLLDVLRRALKTVDFRLGARCIAAEECDRGAVA